MPEGEKASRHLVGDTQGHKSGPFDLSGELRLAGFI